ncbi:endolytic transglycosylase MltG [Candidatus Uhrbacteria bacterium CG10_big_fil_rev_8_21_14_0_10_48_16]|uniref:Endolytic murein transglycosylase n=1 Tax=Candidatus Uhrbacteria bacterium CG10_big_fil_rev_8_21_14_0_10_48_16 TaxID=1975038 RepID=A0A2M8LH36_9BACT|nr:MAG: endolytic transglycosylase MltG [Candidatus Uhrbacteria bacterium CG10_big_fil_rev_8_21_14_0_10_48_16]
MMKFFGLVLGIAVLVGVVLSGSYVFDAYLISSDEDAGSVSITIEEGSSVGEIAQQLEEQGIITSAFFFKVYIRLSDVVLQAGTFELKQGMSLRSTALALSTGQAQEVQITIPEGYTLDQVGEVVLEMMPEVTQEEWEEVTGPDGKGIVSESEMLSGIPNGQGLEGYLFPDTYRFRTDASATTIAETMVLTLKRRLAENDIVIPRNLIFEGGLTFHEMMTLASIVEREVRGAEDMKIVAGIFYTRMQIGMALQADSTVNYVTGKDTPSISLDDSHIDSPYNTYRNLGLPPGPISNPGMNAILAVLNPVDTDYMYFLTAEDGEVIYSRTFDEHIANKYKYLK